jgi:hypothetical protein
MTDTATDREQGDAPKARSYPEGIELSDDDLDHVVGGLDPEAVRAQVAYLQKYFGLR